MNKLLLAAAAFTLLASAAKAEEVKTSEGVVVAINIDAGSLTLANGEAFRMTDPDLLYGYARGDAVVVTYDFENNQLVGHGLYRVPMSGSF